MALHPVNTQSLRHFLQRLGQCYHHSGHVYLVGGSSLILVQGKESTFDIDLQFDIAPEHHTEFIRCLRQISRETGIPVEQASPEQFLPLPKGYQERHVYIGRYGNLELFHFDFYSTALSKIHRGNEKDLADVIRMLQGEIISLSQLETYFAEILPQLETVRLDADADDFVRKFNLLKSRLL